MTATLAMRWMLSSCTLADAGRQEPPNLVDATRLPIEKDLDEELIRVDVRGAVAATEAALRDARALSPAPRADRRPRRLLPARLLTPSSRSTSDALHSCPGPS